MGKSGPQQYIVPNVSLDFARNSEKKIDFRTQSNVKRENTYSTSLRTGITNTFLFESNKSTLIKNLNHHETM